MKEKIKKLCSVTLLVAIAMAAGCKKQETTSIVKTETKTEANNILDKKIVKFLAITLNVDENEIKFDGKKNVVTVRSLTFDKAELTKSYEESNAYKAKYENN